LEGVIRRVSPAALVVDGVLAALAVLVRFILPPDSVLLAIAIVGFGAALALHRLSPWLALGISWLCAILQMLSGAPPDAANLAILAVLYATARYGNRALRWVGFASSIVGAAVAALYLVVPAVVVSTLAPAHAGIQFLLLFIAFLALLGLSWTVGLLARSVTLSRDLRRSRAEAERVALVEQERARIARDMHDVVAHSLAVVIAQADGGRYASAADPAAADAALATIAATARESLADVRLLLGQLRTETIAGPQPTLADLDALVAQVRASGLDVTLVREGGTGPLPVSAQLAIFRVVQEALTNALRHGDVDAPVSVRIRALPDRVEALVENARRPGEREPVTPGHGLTGMHERALLVGGRLEAESRGDRFVVRFEVPVRMEETA
jgi:signal transduction histidine kinase